MTEKIDVLIVSPCSAPRKVQLENTLKAEQVVVGGYIEVVHPFDDPEVAMIVNEEGKLLGLEPNRAITYPNGARDIVVGSFIICGDAGENFASLTPQQQDKYAEMFKSPEVLVKLAGDLHMMNPFDIGERVYRIYQLRHGDEYRDFRFVGLEELKKSGHEVDSKNYDIVYSGPLRDRNLSELYREFNIGHPSDFCGHSMSISDVIVISDGKNETAHYVDRMGFTKLDSFPTQDSPQRPMGRKKPPKKRGGDAR